MDYNRRRDLEGQAADSAAQARGLRRQVTFEEADGLWQAGDRAAALRVLHNTGHTDEMAGFCRERGMSDGEARTEIRNANIDWS
jgi:hypothetical protein